VVTHGQTLAGRGTVAVTWVMAAKRSCEGAFWTHLNTLELFAHLPYGLETPSLFRLFHLPNARNNPIPSVLVCWPIRIGRRKSIRRGNALQNGSPEEVFIFAIISGYLQASRSCSSRLAKNGDFSRVTTKRCNVFMDPCQG
jgi:hypothetical protein